MPSLDWKGRNAVLTHAETVPCRLLHAVPELSVGDDTGNLLVQGDNLHAPKSLLPRYAGAVKCIYIDPPYNTGNEKWVYNDNVNAPEIREWLKKAVDRDDLNRHDKWLCLMYPRLQLLKKFLRPDGAIFVSIDDNEVHHLRLLMDEIFGSQNFVASVVWQHSVQGKNDSKTVSNHHNHLLSYAVSPAFAVGLLPRTDEHNVNYSNPDDDPNGLWRSGDVRSPHYRANLCYDILTPAGKTIAPPAKGWRWEKKTLQVKIETGEIVFRNDETKIVRKIYLDNQGGRVTESIWLAQDVGTMREASAELKTLFGDEAIFDTPKMSHFTGLDDAATAGLEMVDGTSQTKTSLANLLALHRPVIISDEAHNARTALSFDTLARLKPCAVVEITATPRTDSNVVFRVSAAELKNEQMIKLPVCFETHPEARTALAATIDRRNTLESLANDERQLGAKYLRPIVLLQCEADVKTKASLTPPVVRQMLIDSQQVTAEQIAIETGDVAEIADWEKAHGSTLFDETCPIRFVLTVNKLREGWDCPFAYVLCSVAELGSATAVEQVLGRILRQPGGKWRGTRALNVAYAYVTSQNFTKTAESLKDALVASGFEDWEAAQAVAAITRPASSAVSGSAGGAGGASISASAPVATTPAFPAPDETDTPATRGKRCVVPVLCRVLPDGTTRRLTEADFEPTDFTLADKNAALSDAEFPKVAATASSGLIDIESTIGAAVRADRTGASYFTALQRQLQLLFPGNFAGADDAARYLDYTIPHKAIPQTESLPYLKRLVAHLLDARGFTIGDLDRERVRLREAAGKKMNGLRKAACDARFDEVMFGADAAPCVSGDITFIFDPDVYAVKTVYSGTQKFRKHYYARIGKMNGEETACAALLDELPRVDFWIRNLEANRLGAFWFPTATDYTYPDFVAVLTDGRVVAIEYKGGNLLTNDDTKEKEAIGELWAASSGGTCVYLMVGVSDYSARLHQLAG